MKLGLFGLCFIMSLGGLIGYFGHDPIHNTITKVEAKADSAHAKADKLANALKE